MSARAFNQGIVDVKKSDGVHGDNRKMPGL